MNTKLENSIELGRGVREVCRQLFLTFVLRTCLLIFWNNMNRKREMKIKTIEIIAKEICHAQRST